MDDLQIIVKKGTSIFLLTTLLMLILGIGSCKKDNSEGPNPPLPGLGEPDNILFTYNSNNSSIYETFMLGNTVGQSIEEGSGVGGWNVMTSVQTGNNLFIAGHKKTSTVDDKHFVIKRLLPDGTLGSETENQDWSNNYENLFGFKVGSRGFIFGLDSYVGSKIYFVQEVLSNGSLAENEACHGTWAHFWETSTPMYVNGHTYLFFHRKATTGFNTNDWFISIVTAGGVISDHQTGTWANFWDVVTSVEHNGKTWLIGHRDGDIHNSYFIQRINSDGTMGDETDRGEWSNYYSDLVGFVSGGKAYILGAQGSSGFSDAKYFIQEITDDGKLGTETFHSSDNKEFHFVATFPLYDDPGSFRYQIGWNLVHNTGVPSAWSPLYSDTWNGMVKMGGGAVLADIDGDANHLLDAVLTGIQSLPGSDRYYYKVAWNLDNSGKYASLSQTIFGPVIGQSQAGGGADVADIDGNGIPDLLLMCVDDPSGDNSFWYHIGWNLGSSGQAATWSNVIKVPALGYYNAGGGAALGDIDKNGRPDAVFVAIDDPTQDNAFWYIVGKNLNTSGIATAWTNKIVAPCDIGWFSQGGGAALADINANGKPDLLLMNIDSPAGPNALWSFVGWDIDINGTVTGWSGKIISATSPGNISAGGGAAVGDIDKNGTHDLLLLDIDNPYGDD